MSKTIDGVTLEDLLRLEHPDATDEEFRAMVWVIETYRELPKHMKKKMHRFMMLVMNKNERAMRLAEQTAAGKITFRQVLEVV